MMTPLLRANLARGRVAGAEVTAFWTVSDMLQLSGNYTRLHMRLHADPESNDEDAEASAGQECQESLLCPRLCRPSAPGGPDDGNAIRRRDSRRRGCRAMRRGTSTLPARFDKACG